MSSDEESINNIQILSDIEDENNDLLEIVEDLQEVEENQNTEEAPQDEAADEQPKDEEREVVKPKRVIRNPQPKLNAETLKGPKGIAALQSYFERVKFKGKGHEHQDLKVIMKTYEYWCHRLFPKFPFDTCIERLEKLGTKRAVQTHIKRIRFDLLLDEDKPIIDSSDEEANVDGFVDVQSDEINLQNQQFDDLLTTSRLPAANQQPTTELTEEQLERMRLNKERAEKLRQERLKKIREKAQVNGTNLEVPSALPGTSGVDNEVDTQSDIFRETNALEQPDFDLESNVRGKSVIRGNASVKKKSNLSDVEMTSVADTPEKINGERDSDQEESTTKVNEQFKSNSPYEGDLVIDEDSNDIPEFSRKTSRLKNHIESDDSDEEMEDRSREPRVKVADVENNINSEENSNDTYNITKNRVSNIVDSDQDVDSNGIDPPTDREVNGVTSNTTENLLVKNACGDDVFRLQKSNLLMRELSDQHDSREIIAVETCVETSSEHNLLSSSKAAVSCSDSENKENSYSMDNVP